MIKKNMKFCKKTLGCVTNFKSPEVEKESFILKKIYSLQE